MSCEKWVKHISLLLCGSLSETETSELEGHLGRCPACRAEMALQREIEKALTVESHSGLGADFTQAVCSKAFRMETKARSPRPWLVFVPPLAAAATVAALFFMGMDLAGQNPSAFGQVAAALVKPVTWISGAVHGLLGGAAEHAPSLDQSSGRAAGLVAALLTGTIPAFWGLRRFIVYLR